MHIKFYKRVTNSILPEMIGIKNGETLFGEGTLSITTPGQVQGHVNHYNIMILAIVCCQKSHQIG